MPALKTYDLFISHAWQYGASYDRLIQMLSNAPNFYFRNYSAPSEKPLQTLDGADVKTKAQIKAAIDQKIQSVNCVLVLSGMYTAYREWMQHEIDTAVRLGRPIIGIKPWGNTVVPQYVTDHADIIVGWNTSTIVQAIREYSL